MISYNNNFTIHLLLLVLKLKYYIVLLRLCLVFQQSSPYCTTTEYIILLLTKNVVFASRPSLYSGDTFFLNFCTVVVLLIHQ